MTAPTALLAAQAALGDRASRINDLMGRAHAILQYELSDERRREWLEDFYDLYPNLRPAQPPRTEAEA